MPVRSWHPRSQVVDGGMHVVDEVLGSVTAAPRNVEQIRNVRKGVARTGAVIQCRLAC